MIEVFFKKNYKYYINNDYFNNFFLINGIKNKKN